MTAASESLRHAFAPTGTLRASLNLGNPILAGRDPQTGAPCGISVDLAVALAAELGLPLDFRTFDTAAASVRAVSAGEADFGFFAIDPDRAREIAFTAPYLLIEGSYLVRTDSPLHDNAEVDRPGHRVVVGQGSAYDLFLTRHLKFATRVSAPSSPAVVDTFLASDAEVAAGVRQQLVQCIGGRTDLRLLPGHFMVIRQAMGLPRDRGDEAAAWLHAFVEARKADGLVARALERHRIQGASLAAPEDGLA